jgi:hypothetical protein
MLTLDETKGVFVEKLEELLDAEAPQEADSAGAYVESPESFQGHGKERIAGVPGAGIVELAGPILLKGIVAVAAAVWAQIKDQAIEDASTAVRDWLARVFRKGEARLSVTTKEETVAAIATSLIRAGWDADKAGRAAKRVWQQGQEAGRRLAATT